MMLLVRFLQWQCLKLVCFIIVFSLFCGGCLWMFLVRYWQLFELLVNNLFSLGRILNEWKLQIGLNQFVVILENFSMWVWLFIFSMWYILCRLVFLLVMLCRLKVMVIRLKLLFGNGRVLVLYCMQFRLSIRSWLVRWLWLIDSMLVLMLFSIIEFLVLMCFFSSVVMLLVLLVRLSMWLFGFICVVVMQQCFYVWCMFRFIRLFIRLQLCVIEVNIWLISFCLFLVVMLWNLKWVVLVLQGDLFMVLIIVLLGVSGIFCLYYGGL